MKKIYEVIQCRQCSLVLQDCKCHPLPCPFCNEEFGFSQDWNIHLMEKHQDQLDNFCSECQCQLYEFEKSDPSKLCFICRMKQILKFKMEMNTL